METRELHNLGRGVRKKKISALGRHMGSRGPRKTRELHSLVPAPPKKKKKAPARLREASRDSSHRPNGAGDKPRSEDA